VAEITESGDVVKFYAIDSQNFNVSTNKTILSDNSTVTFINITFHLFQEATLLITTASYENPHTLTFANHLVDVAENGVKYSMLVENWDFEKITNQLEIVIESSSNYNSSQSISTSADGTDGRNLQWMKLSVYGVSLYAKFLEFAVIDDEVQTVQFNYIPNNNGAVEVHALVPHFWNYAEIDPNYAVLVETKAGTPEMPSSSGGRGLSTITKIIIIACVLGVAGIVGAIGLILMQRRVIQRESMITRKISQMQLTSGSVEMDTLRISSSPLPPLFT